MYKECNLRYSTCKLVVEGGKNAISLHASSTRLEKVNENYKRA
jgi:hypothetical protein